MSGEALPVCSPERTSTAKMGLGCPCGKQLCRSWSGGPVGHDGCSQGAAVGLPWEGASSTAREVLVLLPSGLLRTQMHWSKSSQGPKDGKGTGGSDSWGGFNSCLCQRLVQTLLSCPGLPVHKKKSLDKVWSASALTGSSELSITPFSQSPSWLGMLWIYSLFQARLSL